MRLFGHYHIGGKLPAVVLEVCGLDCLLDQEAADPLAGVDPGAADGTPVVLCLFSAS